MLARNFFTCPNGTSPLSRKWRVLLEAARQVVSVLPAGEIGKCVLTRRGELFTGDAEQARRALTGGDLLFHAGRLRGAFPRIVG
jgi:hypothetical protein